jgi:tellurite methyltransferase
MAETADERERWNRRWSERGVHALQRPPSAWLVANRAFVLQAPGRHALDVACGDGRNAAYLARLGFAVRAIDISDAAIDGVQSAARTAGLAIDARQLDLERDRLPVARFDVVIIFNYLQRDLFPDLVAALTPGGILVAETFTRAHATQLGNAVSERYLLAPGELRAAFADLQLLRYREGVRHDTGRPRAVAGVVGRR